VAVDHAAVALARRRVKRAGGLLREAASDLAAALSGDATTFGVVHASDEHTIAEATAAVRLAVERHGAVDVVIVAEPRRPPKPAPGIGDRTDDHRSEARR
jgi:hypothetical protein